MIASGTIIIDGQTYRKGDVIHDLGGWDCIDTDGSKRYYWGKSSEVDKLPHYVASDSTALCVDTGELYGFYAPDSKWFFQTARCLLKNRPVMVLVLNIQIKI